MFISAHAETDSLYVYKYLVNKADSDIFLKEYPYPLSKVTSLKEYTHNWILPSPLLFLPYFL